MAAGSSTGPSTSMVRRLNDEVVCRALHRRGPLTRADLASLAGVSAPAMLKMVQRLMAAGLVVEAGQAPAAARGPRAQLFALAPDAGVVTAATPLPGRLAMARWTMAGERLVREDLPFDHTGDIAGQVVDAVRLPHELAGRRHSIVVGLPGAVDPATGDVMAATELPRWRPGTANRIRAGLDEPVVFDNEVNLRALAEAGEDDRDFVLLSLGEGIGAALMLDGRLVRGTRGAAGEVGWMVTGHGSRHRSMQDLAGAWELAASVGREHTPDYGWLQDLAREAAPGDSRWETLAERIAPGVISLVVTLDPPLVVLGGETSRAAGEALRAAVERAVSRELLWPAPGIRLSRAGDEGVLEGGYRWGWDVLLETALGGEA